jgi:hypothetical protein
MSECACTRIYIWSLEWIMLLPLTLCERRSRGFKFAVFWLTLPWAAITLPLIFAFSLIGLVGMIWDMLDE